MVKYPVAALLALLAASVVSGCDDPEVTSAVSVALSHGAVSAQVKCSGTADFPSGSTAYSFEDVRFLDGSAFVSLAANTNGTQAAKFFARGDAPALVWKFEDATCLNLVEASEGYLSIYSTGTCATVYDTVDLESCTGFNLEAFGVE